MGMALMEKGDYDLNLYANKETLITRDILAEEAKRVLLATLSTRNEEKRQSVWQKMRFYVD